MATDGLIRAAFGKNGYHYMASAVKPPRAMKVPQNQAMMAVANRYSKGGRGGSGAGGAPISPRPVSVKTQPRSSHPSREFGNPAKVTGGGRKGPGRGSKGSKGPGRPRGPQTGAGTDWLAPMTGAQITKQATDTITKSYNPTFTDLNNQQAQANAIDAKRASDSKVYQAWLATQGATLQQHNAQANQMLNNALGAINAAQQAYYQGNPDDIAAVQSVGTSPKAADAVTNAGLLANSVAAGKASAAVPQQQDLVNAAGRTDETGAVIANSYAQESANRQKQVSDLDTVLTNIANARAKTSAAQTGDIAKEVARLQGVEIQKAQSNENFAAAEDKLGIAAANTRSLINTRKGNLDVARSNSKAKWQGIWDTKAASDRTFQLNKKKLGLSTARDLYMRQHGLGPYRVSKGRSGPGSGPGALTTGTQNSIFTAINKARSQMLNMVHNGLDSNGNRISWQQAYHLVRDGGTWYLNSPHLTAPSKGNPRGKGYYSPSPQRTTALTDARFLNAAYNLAHQGYINSSDLAALNHAGVYGVRARYTVKNSPRTVGGAITGAGGVGHVVSGVVGGP